MCWKVCKEHSGTDVNLSSELDNNSSEQSPSAVSSMMGAVGTICASEECQSGIDKVVKACPEVVKVGNNSLSPKTRSQQRSYTTH